MEESKREAQRKTAKTRESCLPGEHTSAESDMSEPGEDVEHSGREEWE